MTTRRISHPVAYAIVLPPSDGRDILLDPQLRRIGYDLWRDGFFGEVVGILIDSGAGTTKDEIRSACTVTVFDVAFTDHVWREVDRFAADAARRQV